MTVTVIILRIGVFAAIVGVAYWFSGEEQKTSTPSN
jgi:hypothetical protein